MDVRINRCNLQFFFPMPFELRCAADNTLKLYRLPSLVIFPSSLSAVSFPLCLAGCRVMCHFIILRWLNYIRNILLLIKPAIGSTWDKTDYKSWEWKHRAQNASVSTLYVCVCVCVCGVVHVCVLVQGRGERASEGERLRGWNGTAKICWCDFVYRWCCSSETVCLTSVRSPPVI